LAFDNYIKHLFDKRILFTKKACHASVAAIHLNYNDQETIKYLQNLEKMHKIIISVQNHEELKSLNDTLLVNEIKFKLWIEEPENVPTCLATKPYSKSLIEKYFKMFKLFR
jgi:peptidyl-tRNA hydrolase